jgi:hypothetical protein
MWMWLCVLVGTAILVVGGWGAMKLYGTWAIKRDEMERERLNQEWKRRAEERKKGLGAAAPAETDETSDNPPRY